MSDGLLALVIGAVLLLHGLGHGGAIGAMWWIAMRPQTNMGGWTAARSWAMPWLGSAATWIAAAFWLVAMVGFVAAALAFWGILLPPEWSRTLAVASAIVSLAGLIAFAGTWPVTTTFAALAVDIAVLVAVLALDWPPRTTGG